MGGTIDPGEGVVLPRRNVAGRIAARTVSGC
jgi:hypothetical protein